jgi:chromosome segregation ATPase
MDENKINPMEEQTPQAQVEKNAEAIPDTKEIQDETEQGFASASQGLAGLEAQLSEAESSADQTAELPENVSDGFNSELTALRSEAAALKESVTSLNERKQKLDAEKSGKQTEPEGATENSGEIDETKPEKTNYLPEIDMDSLLVDLPVQANGKEDRIKGLINLDLFKHGSLREIARAQNYADSDPVVTDIASKIQDKLWDKRVEKLKPEFQLVMKSEIPTARDTATHLLTIGGEQLHAEIDEIKQEIRVLEQRKAKLNSKPENERGPADNGHMQFNQTRIDESRNIQKALESIGRTPGYFELTDQWKQGDANVKKEIEPKIEQLLSK